MVLESLAQAWATERDKIEESSVAVVQQLAEAARWEARRSAPDPGVLDSAFYGFRRSFDTRLGGFGGPPKFPRPSVHDFLVRYYARTQNEEAIEMVLTTLREMAKGGMHDQLGGGFHRYSVDGRWFVPHFEKMLYDQAQLAISYLEAYQITRDHLFAGIARDIFTYVLRDMTSPEGAFYSAEDADSVIDPSQPKVKGEGAFYIWSKQEIASLLDAPTVDWFCFAYGVEDGGNVRDDPQGEFRGRNILYQAHTLEETAKQYDVSPEEIRSALEGARQKLLEARSKRVRPHLDDKVLTAWNSLMISAFAKGAQVLQEPAYADAARRSAEFLVARIYDPEKRSLMRRYREGEAAIPAFLDDYACLIEALVDLYETDFDASRLELAADLAGKMRELFEDAESGGFYSSAADDNNLILRVKDDYDGAEPSGNSIAARALIRLAHLTGRDDLRDAAERTLAAFGQRLNASAVALPAMMVALMAFLEPPRHIVIAGRRDEAADMLAAVRVRFLPWASVLVKTNGEGGPERLASMKPIDGKPTAYICEDFVCRTPVTKVSELEQLLQ
jgi:uncharacterized protein YyaL (SSP411 family)